MLQMVVALAQIDTTNLTAGIWMYDSSSIEFKEDGSGIFVNNSGKSFEMTWTQADDQICVEYQFYGKRKLNLTVVEKEGVWTLTDKDGKAYSIGGSAAQKEDNSYTVAFGEEIDLGFAKMTFARVQLMREMHASAKGAYTTAPNDSHYFALVGTITNTSTGSLEVGNLCGEIMLDQYVYEASAKADHNDQLTTSITPMSTSTYYVFSTLPDALTKVASSGEIKLAFNDGFNGKPSGIDQADFVFKFTFDDKAVAKAWLPPEKEIVYFSDCPALPMPASYAEVDEVSNFVMSDYNMYTYEGSSVGAKANATDFINTVTAQSACDYYIFASVPASVLNRYKTCTIKLVYCTIDI